MVTAKVGDMKGKERVERSSMMRKEVMVCVQFVVGKHKFLFKFKYGHKR